MFIRLLQYLFAGVIFQEACHGLPCDSPALEIARVLGRQYHKATQLYTDSYRRFALQTDGVNGGDHPGSKALLHKCQDLQESRNRSREILRNLVANLSVQYYEVGDKECLAALEQLSIEYKI